MTLWWMDCEAEAGEDARKLTNSLAARYRERISLLLQLELLPSDRDLMEAMERMPDAGLNEQRRHWVQQMLWHYRQLLPPGVAPKANPRDPIVRDMIAAEERAYV